MDIIFKFKFFTVFLKLSFLNFCEKKTNIESRGLQNMQLQWGRLPQVADKIRKICNAQPAMAGCSRFAVYSEV